MVEEVASATYSRYSTRTRHPSRYARVQPWRGQSAEAVATDLLLSGLDEGEILDLLRLVWRKYGYSRKLRAVALMVLKSHAPRGRERAA